VNVCSVQLDAVDSSGLVMPVSVWSYRLNESMSTDGSDSPPPPAAAADGGGGAGAGAGGGGQRRRRLLVMEPVNSITVHVSFDSHVSLAVFTFSCC